MERSEKVGLGIAVAGHLVLFGLLSVGFLSTPNPEKLKQQPIDVSLVKDVGLEATAPQAVEEPAQSVAPETGEPDDAAPPAPADPAPAPEPVPAPPQPAPKAAPPEPAPKAAPKPEPKPKPAPPKPKPAPKPAEKPKPAPKPKAAPAAEKAAPKKTTAPAAEKAAKAAAAAKQAAADARAKAAAAAKQAAADAKAKAAAAAKARGSGSDSESKASKPRGGRLGDDFLKGLTTEKSTSRSQTPRAAKIDSRALASIVQAIARQIQPCADRQVDPGPGANEIVTTLNLKLNENGTLAATPTMVRQTGVTAENERYAQRVRDLGIAAFKGCSPLKLPAEYYDTPNGGWNNINFKWKLR